MLESRFHLDNLLFIFLRFLLVTLSMYLFAGKARKKQLLLFESVKYLLKYLHKVSNSNPKTRCEIC